MAFSPKIDNTDIKLLMPCHNKLVQPLLMDKQSLSGLIISKLFKQKSVYLHPSRQILQLPDSQVPKKGLDEKTDMVLWLESEEPFSNNSAETEYPSSSDPLKDSNITANPMSANTTEEHPCQISSSHSVISEGFVDHYRCYTELLVDNVHIPDDEEFHNSNTNIAEQNEAHESESNDITLKDLLSNLALQIDSEKTCKFNINRRNIWDGARRAFLRKTYKATNRISVMFTDSSGNSEGAVDFGGPTREFLRLLIHHLQHSKLFEVPENRKTLSCDAQGMRNDEYYLAGQALAISLVHGGPAPNFLSPILYQCLVSDAKNVNCSLGDVVDPDTQDMLQEIDDSASIENLQGLIQKHSTILSVAGCFRPLKSQNDKKELLEDFISWYIVGRTVPSLIRLKEGLKTLGVLQAIEIHKQLFEEAFIWKEQEITTDIINGMFNINFSSSGSNYRLQEEHIIGYWRDYLQDCEELACEDKLKDILCFVTGANTIPPLGFNPQPSIEFLHACNGQVQMSMFSEANTCGNVLRLPLSISYEEFKTNMDFGILNSPGFGEPSDHIEMMGIMHIYDKVVIDTKD